MHIQIDRIEPFADGAVFGETGAYERVQGKFRGELDPADARNRVIALLDQAPRNAHGKVAYEADFFLLRPAHPARGNRTLIYAAPKRLHASIPPALRRPRMRRTKGRVRTAAQ